MISVIKSLMAGDTTIASKFAIANAFWKAFFETADASTAESLARELGRAQSNLEIELNLERGFAKEIMPYTCLGYLYDEQNGFPDRALAKRVVQAFEKSGVSIEVKSYSEDAAVLFNLTDD